MQNLSNDALDRTFAALADPTRRALLSALRDGSATVNELAAPFDVSLAAISKHLRVLERAGLLQRVVKGREHHCSLDATPLSAASDYTADYVRFWEDRLDSLDAYLRKNSFEGNTAQKNTAGKNLAGKNTSTNSPSRGRSR